MLLRLGLLAIISCFTVVSCNKICEKFPEKCFKDVWGHKTFWHDLEDGWNDEKRDSLLQLDDINRVRKMFRR